MKKWTNIQDTTFYDPDAESKEGKIVSDNEEHFKKIKRARKYLYLFRKSLILLFGEEYYAFHLKSNLDEIENKIDKVGIIA